MKVHEENTNYIIGSYEKVGAVEIYTYEIHETAGQLADMNNGDACFSAWQVVFTPKTTLRIYDGYSDTIEETIEIDRAWDWMEGCNKNIQEVYDKLIANL